MPLEFVSPKLRAIVERDPGLAIEDAMRSLEIGLQALETWAATHQREPEEAQRQTGNDQEGANSLVP